jgi:hypothetical protein
MAARRRLEATDADRTRLHRSPQGPRPGRGTGLDQAAIEAVRGGAQPGDPLPPRQAEPYIRRVTDTEVIITGTGQGRRVAVLFSHASFSGARFGHRFPPGLDEYGGDPVYLREEIDRRLAPHDAGPARPRRQRHHLDNLGRPRRPLRAGQANRGDRA